MSQNNDEVLVRVEGVSKKFCRSLKKSLWYGVCDIASELNPFGRTASYANSNKSLTTIERHGGRENRKLGKAEERATESWPQKSAAAGTMQVNEQLKLGPKGAAPKGRRRTKYLLMTSPAIENEIIIKATRGWRGLDLAEIWRYRDLLFLLVHRDFVSNYKQTVLGPLWFIIQPLLTTVVFTIIFGKVAKIPTDGMPPMLFYLAGLLGWNFFSRTLNSTSSTLTSNLGLFGKVYFPRMVVPLAAVVSSFIALGIQFATFLCFWCYFKFFTSAGPTIQLGWDLALFPLVLLQVCALGLGVGLWLSALTAKYRDLGFLTGTLVQLWMYATPIIYPVSQIPEKWRWVSSMNPMEMPVVAIRHMFLGQAGGVVGDFTLSILLTFMLLGTGVLAFNKVEKTFVDIA